MLSGWIFFFTIVKSNIDLREELIKKESEIVALDWQLQRRLNDIQVLKQMYYMTNTKLPTKKRKE
jgi:hypothetical protein